MYSLYANGECFYYDASSEQEDKVVDPVLRLSDNAAGSLEFALPPSNVLYGTFDRMRTIITVDRDGEEIWEGRILSEEEDFFKRKKYYCEGSLSYLNDTTQPPAVYNLALREYMREILRNHNNKVDESKQFQIGIVTVIENVDDREKTTNYETTLEVLNKLVTDLKGHLRVRKENGVRYLDFLKDFPTTSQQKIEFGKNLLDFTRKYDMTDMATVVIPLGKQVEREAIADEIFFNTRGNCALYSNGFIGELSAYKASERFPVAAYDPPGDPSTWGEEQNSRVKNIYHYSGSNHNGNIMYAFYDINGNMLSSESARNEDDFTTVMLKEPSVPEKAAYCAIAGYYPYAGVIDNFPGRGRIEFPYPGMFGGNPEGIDYVVNPEPQRSGYIIDDKGFYVKCDGYEYVVSDTYIPCEPGQKFFYTGTQDNGNGMYIFTDDEGHALQYKSAQKSDVPTIIENETITAPAGATRLWVAGKNTSELRLFNYDTKADKVNVRLTVTTVNEGSPYVVSAEALEAFGWIEKVIEFPDVENENDLLAKAQAYLHDEQFDRLELEITALDLHYLNASTDSFNLLDRVRCVSSPHGLDKMLPVREVEIPLDKPGDTKYVLGESASITLIQSSTRVEDELLEQISRLPTRSSVLDAAKEQATAIMHQRTTGYVTLTDTDRYGTVLYITDTEDYEHCNNMWMFSLNGLGFSSDGGRTFGLAMTMDGSIVADYITAGTMSADRVRTGLLIGEDGVNYWDLNTGEFQLMDPRVVLKEDGMSTEEAVRHGKYLRNIVKDLQDRADSKIETWHQYLDPSVEWTTAEDRRIHIGDLWHCSRNIYYGVLPPSAPYKRNDVWFKGSSSSADTTGTIYVATTGREKNDSAASINDWSIERTNYPKFANFSSVSSNTALELKKNQSYRWNGSRWTEESAPAELFDKIDGKAQVFVGANVPDPPYQVNDIWMKSSGENSGEEYVCIMGRANGSGHLSDWQVRNGYIGPSMKPEDHEIVFSRLFGEPLDDIDDPNQNREDYSAQSNLIQGVVSRRGVDGKLYVYISAEIIRAGVLQSQNGHLKFNLNDGTMSTNKSTGDRIVFDGTVISGYKYGNSNRKSYIDFDSTKGGYGSDSYCLDIKSSSHLAIDAGGIISISAGRSGGDYFFVGDYDVYMYANVAVGELYSMYDITAPNVGSSSDIRLKHDVRNSDIKALSFVNSLPVRSFVWNKDDHTERAGFVADEIEEIEQDYCKDNNTNHIVTVGKDGYKQYSITKMIPILWKAVQELSRKVDNAYANV